MSGYSAGLSLKKNPYSTQQETHPFFIIGTRMAVIHYTWLLDCWTPVGMLSMNLTDSVRIRETFGRIGISHRRSRSKEVRDGI